MAFFATLVLAALASEWRVLAVLLLALLLATLLSRGVFRQVARDRSWPLLAALALGLGAFMGDRDLALGPMVLSSAGLSLGVQMMVRAMAILLAVYTLTTSVSLSTLAHLLERLGFRGLGFALGVAVNALPMVQRNFREVMMALRLRGGFRRRRMHALRLLLLATTVNSVRHAEEIVAAAEARGYGIGRRSPERLTLRTGDVVMVILLAGAGTAIFA